MFSEYCVKKFEVEPVEVVNASGVSNVYPDLSCRSMKVSLSYISGAIGVPFEAKQVCCVHISFLGSDSKQKI